MPTSSATKTILTAAHWGPMLVETDGENVLSSRGALETSFANSLQTAVREQVHSKTRVRYPMVRKGFLASPDSPQGVRGQDEFVRVSWQEALILSTHSIGGFGKATARHRFLPAPTAGVLTAYSTRRRRCCSAT